MDILRITFKLLSILICFFLLSCDRTENKQLQRDSPPQPQFDGTIIALGDSLTAGLGVDESNAWPSLLENRLHENGYNWKVINAGVSGETSSGALARIKWILAQKPDIVILETGANDGLRGIPVTVISENISKAVQMLQESNISVVLAGMQIVQNLGHEYTSAFTEIYQAVASEKGCILIPFLLQDVAGISSLNQADTIHPNEKGHGIIADTVYPYVVKVLSVHSL